MAGVDTIIRLLGGTLAIVIIIVVGAFGWQVIEPVYNNLTLGDLPAGWGTPQNTLLLFVSLSSIGLIAVVVIWWLVAPVREDVRQDVGPPRF